MLPYGGRKGINYYATKTYGGVKVQLHLAVDGAEWPPSRS
jgi:hypothetical protein